MSTTHRSRIRWIIPAAALAAVVTVPALVSRAQADSPKLPAVTAEQLVQDVMTAKPVAFQGDVSQKVDLGIPAFPGEMGGLGGKSSQIGGVDPLSLLTGNHQWRVWTNATDSARVSLVDRHAEKTLIVNPTTTWVWDSGAQTAYKGTTPTPAKSAEPSNGKKPEGFPKSPAEASKQLIAAMTPTTTVSVDGTAKVAGQNAYQLVLTPKQKNTLVQQVRVAVDAQTKMPLSLKVVSSRTNKAAVDLGFTSVSYGNPEAKVFSFTPPSGTKVEGLDKLAPAEHEGSGKSLPVEPPTGKAPSGKKGPADKLGPTDKTGRSAHKVIGTGWSTIVVGKSGQDVPAELSGMLKVLPETSGSWGKGRILQGTLFTVVVTDDGRMAAGAVPAEELYKALS